MGTGSSTLISQTGEGRSVLTDFRLRHCVLILILVSIPTLGWAQVGRLFVSVEAYVGLARVVHVGKIVELKPIDYEQPLTSIQKLGKPHRLVLAVSETIRGDAAKRLELVLSLQVTYELEYLRDQSIEIMLVGGPDLIGSFPRAEVGIEEQGQRVDGQRYQFRLLGPVKVLESGNGKQIASQLNSAYDSGRMFTDELEVVAGREAILKRSRAFASEHTQILPEVTLMVPNEFGALCGRPNAFCLITLPVCPDTRKTLNALKNDPGLVLRHIKSPDEDYDRARLLAEIEKALAKFPDGAGK